MTTQKWDNYTGLKVDDCDHDQESEAVGKYSYEAPGYYWCQSQKKYVKLLNDRGHFQKEYRSGCHIDADSKLRYAELTDPNLINQLYTRPYVGCYKGAGQRALTKNVLETHLLTGIDTRIRPACDVLADAYVDRFQYLPEYGNPQRVKHVIPAWHWGGTNTRDYVRRINYIKHCEKK